MVTTLALFSVAVVVVSLVGGLLPLATVLSHTRLQVYLSVSAGAMLGAAFFHMMPESVRIAGSPDALKWSAAGLLLLFLVERFFAYHHHEHPADEETESHAHAPKDEHSHSHEHEHSTHRTSLHWGAAACGLAVHSLAGGVALASAVAADFGIHKSVGPAAMGVFFATLVHKPADALTIVSLMIRAGAPRSLAHIINLLFALMIPAGMMLFAVGVGSLSQHAANELTAAALAFSAGTFLCISLSDILPELQFHAHDRLKLSVALIAGLALMGMASLFEGTEPHAAPATAAPVEKPAPEPIR